jgi:hypothetical protein
METRRPGVHSDIRAKPGVASLSVLSRVVHICRSALAEALGIGHYACVPDTTRERLHRVWTALNRRRRPGAFWIEFGVLIAVFALWFAVSAYVYSPTGTSEFSVLGWFLSAYVPYWAWVVWYRNRYPEQTPDAPEGSADQPLAPGMVDPMQWHAEWVQRQRNRWQSARFRVLWFGMAALTVAIVLLGVVSRFYLLLAVGALLAAGLGADWWRYSPHSRGSA